MKKVENSKELLDLLSKKYILVAVAISNQKGYFVNQVKSKYIFSNEFLTIKYTKQMFLDLIGEYNFYLVESKEQVVINQDFDINTLKQ